MEQDWSVEKGGLFGQRYRRSGPPVTGEWKKKYNRGDTRIIYFCVHNHIYKGVFSFGFSGLMKRTLCKNCAVFKYRMERSG